jgi:hypothetical protein
MWQTRLGLERFGLDINRLGVSIRVIRLMGRVGGYRIESKLKLSK